MDKIQLTMSDVDRLLAWRDEHKTEVYAMPSPLKAIEITVDNESVVITYKAIRENLNLRMHVNIDGHPIGNLEFKIIPGAFCVVTKNKSNIPQDAVQSMLTIYSSLMACMVYSVPTVRDNPETRKTQTTNGKAKSKKNKSKAAPNITYILRETNGRLIAAPQGSHASPKGEFSVRGHYRHYKNGKTVWINPYKKGTGNKKSKVYRLGGNATHENGKS
jgi:hypothetical protein